MGLAGTHPSGLPFFCPNGDHLTQPPPAHMGIPPYGTLDAGKAAAAAGEYLNIYAFKLNIPTGSTMMSSFVVSSFFSLIFVFTAIR